MEILSNPATLWFIAGTILLLLEFVVPGVIILFFGIGAWITSATVFAFEPSITWQLLIFSISSVLSLTLLRKLLLKRIYSDNTPDPDEEFIGHTAIVKEEITPKKDGKIEFKGALWGASSKENIAAGNKVIIIDKSGINLVVMDNK